jgi:DNA-directed RNA polymerase sigma subunit (sigma70/sigma32)
MARLGAQTGEVEAAHEMAASHLPIVVKTAYQHRHYLIAVQGPIQEGALGFTKTVGQDSMDQGHRAV